MTVCCGSERASKYCPECGTALSRWGKESLLKYLERQHRVQSERLRAAQEKLDRLAKEGHEPGDTKYLNAQKSERTRRHLVKKYDGWIEVVKGVTPCP